MFKNIFVIILSVVFMAFSTNLVYANTNGSSSDDFLKLTIPDVKSGPEFNLAMLWLKAGASNLNYVILNKGLPLQSPSWLERELRPSFTPAIELGVRYFFQSAGEDIRLGWTHLNNSTSSSTVADNNTYFLGPDYEIGPVGIPIRTALGHAKFKYDVINVDVGQYIGFGQLLQMRFFGGLSTGFLREEVIATYSGTTTGTYAGPFSMRQDVVSSFRGIGPRGGISANYHASSSFSLVGETGVSALIGSLFSKTSYIGSAQELLERYGQTTNYQTIEDQRVQQVIPGVDAKLGISYQRAFNKDTLFTATVGYQAALYINAISQYLPASLVANQGLETGSIFVATMSHTLSNYSVQGPFLNFALRWF